VKLLLDMNLTPRWVGFLQSRGVEAVHWSSIGDPRAKDATIMAWARDHGYVLFTHDLDFSTLLAMTHAAGPSVLQVRTQDVLPEAIGDHVLQVLSTHGDPLEQGAVVTIDETTARVRILPIGRVQGK
jgi:predicted nuclease of predicted toxin-antitoxin system